MPDAHRPATAAGPLRVFALLHQALTVLLNLGEPGAPMTDASTIL